MPSWASMTPRYHKHSYLNDETLQLQGVISTITPRWASVSSDWSYLTPVDNPPRLQYDWSSTPPQWPPTKWASRTALPSTEWFSPSQWRSSMTQKWLCQVPRLSCMTLGWAYAAPMWANFRELSDYRLIGWANFELSDYRNIEYQTGKLGKLSDYRTSNWELKLSDYHLTDFQKKLSVAQLCSNN